MANWVDNIPVPMDANGCVVPLDTKELVCRGETRGVCGFSYSTWNSRWRVVFMNMDATDLSACTMPDSWERLEEDVQKAMKSDDICGYFDKVDKSCIECPVRGIRGTCSVNVLQDALRRAKALAGVTEND